MPLTVSWPHADRLSTLKCPQDSASNAALINAVNARYHTYVHDMRTLASQRDYHGMAEVLRAYSTTAKALEKRACEPEKPNILSTKTKYYSSILEELPVLLMEDRVQRLLASDPTLNARNLHLGSKNCVIRVGISPNATIFTEKKRIDCALSVEMDEIDGWCPLVGLEVKKYIDKTMFGTILDTYKSLRTFRPVTYYGFLAEDEARERTVIDNSEMLDKEFILTGCSRNRGALHTFRADALEHLDNSLQRALTVNFRHLQG